MAEENALDRREALKKGALAAGVGAAAFSAPSIQSMSVAPRFASATSDTCVPMTGTTDLNHSVNCGASCSTGTGEGIILNTNGNWAISDLVTGITFTEEEYCSATGISTGSINITPTNDNDECFITGFVIDDGGVVTVYPVDAGTTATVEWPRNPDRPCNATWGLQITCQQIDCV